MAQARDLRRQAAAGGGRRRQAAAASRPLPQRALKAAYACDCDWPTLATRIIFMSHAIVPSKLHTSAQPLAHVTCGAKDSGTDPLSYTHTHTHHARPKRPALLRILNAPCSSGSGCPRRAQPHFGCVAPGEADVAPRRRRRPPRARALVA